MARLNTNPSSRRSESQGLYRDPTPLSQLNGAPSTRASTYSVMSPAQSTNSDKENQQPESRDSTPKPVNKGKRPIANPRLPTPNSGSSSSGNGNKRRRTGNYSISDSTPVYQDQDEDAQGNHDVEDDDGTKYYDPNQDPEVRRVLRANIRKNHRKIEENRDELTKPDNPDLLNHLRIANQLMKDVKQTADAALDSRTLTTISEYGVKKTNNSVLGNIALGLDLDHFVSKCITFMRFGGVQADDEDQAAASTQARNRRQTAVQDDEDDKDESGDGLDWAVLGAKACFPSNKRPPVSSFLLGPLSVQKRVRTTQTRRAKSQRQPTGPATQPQELQHSDIKQSESSNLTHLVKGIKSRLEQHITAGEEKVEAELAQYGDEVEEDDFEVACKRHRIRRSEDGESCVSMFDFTINPKSFGQTVENLFYVSFLIREGNVKVLEDGDGLPVLVPSQPHSIQEQREQNVQKHQAVFSLDWPTWKTLIEAFDIKEPLIPYRVQEETAVSAGAWYG
ncbi:Nse4-domain-containing protein [Zopfia rhizophila CBS 207.26]|uniref:Non-structural maintenance of chromosomes element 4 n=1 Tax=Zopfia rhizophila CBS 207.26 TaxID=1314779 RepID=A0A6A6E8K8_9PEZI|nr:Nse4-domain-containing protein [Zopfia rhizophila CBS 207.26]